MNEVLLCLLSGGVAAAMIKAIESIVTWKLNRKAAKEDKAEERKESEEKKLDEDIKELQKSIEELRAGEKIILYDRVKYLARAFVEDGEISFDDREDLTAMHSIYHNELGGNGNLDALMSEVMKLHVK